MLSRLLSGNPAARHDFRLRRLLPKFAAHPQRMHRTEIGIESRISRARGKFNDANSTHYSLCTDETRGMQCPLPSAADVRTGTGIFLFAPQVAIRSRGEGSRAVVDR